jgi:transposase-like protein
MFCERIMLAQETIKINCPKCNGDVIRYGKNSDKQVYFCKNCNVKFSDNGLKNKTYAPLIITNAITYYNLGNTLDETVKLVNKRFNIKVSKSTVHFWINDFSKICSYKKLRRDILKNYKNDKEKIIESCSFKHSGLTYNFMYHKPKLGMLCKKFPTLSNFILNMRKDCPSTYFENGERCSSFKLDVDVRKEGRYNQACKLAGFSLKGCNKNTERHNLVEFHAGK